MTGRIGQAGGQVNVRHYGRAAIMGSDVVVDVPPGAEQGRPGSDKAGAVAPNAVLGALV